MKELWVSSFFSLFRLLPPKSKLPWSHPWVNVIPSSLSSLYPSCPLEAALHTTENANQVLLLLCPNFSRALHLTSSETESLYCGWLGIPESASGPLLCPPSLPSSHTTLILIYSTWVPLFSLLFLEYAIHPPFSEPFHIHVYLIGLFFLQIVTSSPFSFHSHFCSNSAF